MNFQHLHPAEQLVEIMNRIYRGGMTTLSGGNLSIKAEGGDVWITPAGIDKGQLAPQDMSCIHADGRITGPHRPSSEYPFHQAIYQARPDLQAIAHAHPPATVAFSISRILPDTRLWPVIHRICGPIGYAPYALTGSDVLGKVIAATFAGGYDTVLLENHGAVAAGESLFQAFQRLEALDFCARALIGARTLGPVAERDDLQGTRSGDSLTQPPKPGMELRNDREQTLRIELGNIARRAYDRQLMLSAEGDLSVRVDPAGFLISPAGHDRRSLAPEDILFVSSDHPDESWEPSKSTRLHPAIYASHPNVGAIILAHPPNATAFAIADVIFDTRTIPESYFLLRDIPRLPFYAQYDDIERIIRTISPQAPVILIENEGVLVTGKDLLQALDRLEVAEYSARSLIATGAIGPLQPIGEKELTELRFALGLV